MNELITLLKQNARFSNQQLASMLGISEAEVAEKIRQLEDDGVIKGYSVIVDENRVDKDMVIANIELKVTPQRDFGFDELAKTIMMYDEVESISLMSGSYDLSVTVKGNNLKSIALFVSQRLATIEGVLSTATHFVLKTYKDKGIFIENEENDERSMIAP
ncbi:MAG: Lrp/AsnC family transcriptional regulator [Ruminococcus sp.]|nr:Lrp/AsnC family transcriptional regulator [Ruminococcus sp.]